MDDAKRGLVCLLACVGAGAGVAAAGTSTAALIGDNMVLQQGMPVPIWGTADPGQTVTVTLQGQSASAKAGADGAWRVNLAPMKPGGPFEMTVAGADTLKFQNVMVGEVWVASGQSNMAWPVGASMNAEAEIASAQYPQIRLFSVPRTASARPSKDLSGAWRPCEPGTVGGFSAVAYFFGRDLHKSQNVPVGLIDASWGGTNIETWTPDEALRAYPMLGPMLDAMDVYKTDVPKAIRQYQRLLDQWERASNHHDTGNTGFAEGWADPEYDAGSWEDAADLSFQPVGAMWFRTEIEIPAGWAGKDLEIDIARADDYDTTYFNGIQVGQTGKERLYYWATPRKYCVPGYCVRPGRNVVAVRVFNNFGPGMLAPGKGVSVVGEDSKPVAFSGPWKRKLEFELKPDESVPGPPMAPQQPGEANAPCSLYNAMIYPLIPYGIRGAIWYQGEANAGGPALYRTLLPAMIQGWRKAWGQGEFPFGFVQLANYLERQAEPSESGWAGLREAQMLSLSCPNTGMAVIIDIGDAVDIHPKNKQDVGGRLALWARAKVHGERIVYSGPIYESMKVEGGKVRVRFTHVGGGLVARGDALTGFAVAGADAKFVWAEAKIDGDTVLVWSDKLPAPTAVRYAWADNPACNLYNKEGLPASPFRTDRPRGPAA